MASFKIEALAIASGHVEIEADTIEEARELIADLGSGDLEFIDGPDILPLSIEGSGLTPEEIAAIYGQISGILRALPRRGLPDLDLFDAIEYELDHAESDEIGRPTMSTIEAMAAMIKRSEEGIAIPAIDGLDYSDYLEWVREDLMKIGAIVEIEEGEE